MTFTDRAGRNTHTVCSHKAVLIIYFKNHALYSQKTVVYIYIHKCAYPYGTHGSNYDLLQQDQYKGAMKYQLVIL